MRAAIFAALSLLLLTAASFLSSGSLSHVHHGLRGHQRRTEEDGSATEAPTAPRKMDLNAVDKFTFSREVFNYIVFTWFDDEETRAEKQAYWQRMTIYHQTMRPCLHKRYWAAMGFMNPMLKQGLEVDEDGLYYIPGDENKRRYPYVKK